MWSSSEERTYSACSFALLDAVYLALDRALALRKLHEQHVRPVLISVESAYASRGVAFDTVANSVVD